jgi:hypothetical protein
MVTPPINPKLSLLVDAGHEAPRSAEAVQAGGAHTIAEGLATASALGQIAWLLRPRVRGPRGRLCPSALGR